MATAKTSEFAKTYHSFSGVDIKAVFGNKAVAELQAISYSITREKAPLYTMGSADPRSFSRGKRGIAGTLIFLMFDRHALLSLFGVDSASPLLFMADKDDFKPASANRSTSNAQETPLSTVGTPDVGAGAFSTEGNFESDLGSSLDSDQEPAAPWFADQIPPFDVTLAAANEYGSFAVMRIYGVEILNEGYGVSIDDIVSEQQMTYVARTLVAWSPVTSGKTALLGGGAGNAGSGTGA